MASVNPGESEPEWFDDDDDFLPCPVCGGEGWVDSVAEHSGRYFWDSNGPGPCPNCKGSGDRKDCTVF